MEELYVELYKYHPIKIVEFYNQLNHLRKDIFTADLYLIYYYIWGRKYQEDHFEHFTEFIIAQGSTELEKIKFDLNRIALLDMNLIKLHQISITGVFVNLYMSFTQKLFPMKDDSEMLRILSSLKEEDLYMVKEKYPEIYKKYK